MRRWGQDWDGWGELVAPHDLWRARRPNLLKIMGFVLKAQNPCGWRPIPENISKNGNEFADCSEALMWPRTLSFPVWRADCRLRHRRLVLQRTLVLLKDSVTWREGWESKLTHFTWHSPFSPCVFLLTLRIWKQRLRISEYLRKHLSDYCGVLEGLHGRLVKAGKSLGSVCGWVWHDWD